VFPGAGFASYTGAVARRLDRTLADLRADVLFVNLSEFEEVALVPPRGRWDLLAAMIHQVPFPGRVRLRARRRLIAEAFRRIDVLLAPSTRVADAWSAAVEVERDRFTVLPYGLPLDAIRAEAATAPRLRALAGLPEDSRVVACVGMLDPRKRQDALVEAFLSVAPDAPGWSLVLIGEGPLRPRVLELTAAHPLGDRVRLLGGRRDARALVGQADIVALVSSAEALPLVLIEAAAQGVPAIATDVGGTADIVVHGETGLLTAGDPGAIAGALRRSMSDPALRGRLGAAARAHADGRFELTRHVARVAAALDEGLARRRSRA
jgi:glycosyltransferase involved in cell wall biosynthesis